jgi:hypothetical protein
VVSTTYACNKLFSVSMNLTLECNLTSLIVIAIVTAVGKVIWLSAGCLSDSDRGSDGYDDEINFPEQHCKTFGREISDGSLCKS